MPEKRVSRHSVSNGPADAQRGIDVVIEVDTPGHTATIAETRPEYVACFEATPWTSKANQPPAGQLRFANGTVQEFAAGLFEALSGVVSSKYVGTGGDEINVECMVRDHFLSLHLYVSRRLVALMQDGR
jgi:hexosaminidase